MHLHAHAQLAVRDLLAKRRAKLLTTDYLRLTMLAQDQFVRDHIEATDTLVVSVGGNDVALRPSVATAL
eukprot:scaffold46517_cov50-Phaeocystis_antarctica.AAC.1